MAPYLQFSICISMAISLYRLNIFLGIFHTLQIFIMEKESS